MLVRFLVAFLTIGAVSTTAIADDCERCEKELSLSESEWACLVKKLPDTQKTKRRFFFLTVSSNPCEQNQTDGSRGRETILPRTNTKAASVLKLSRSQVQCLVRYSEPVKPKNGKVRFDFSEQCIAETSDTEDAG